MNKINLPLSWILTNSDSSYKDKRISLRNKLTWYAFFHFSNNRKWIDTVSKLNTQKILIRGVSGQGAAILKNYGFIKHQTGEEAVINLRINLNWKKSLRELYKRGRKLGVFSEIPYSIENAEKLKNFKILSRHGSKPELKYLFNGSFSLDTRLFVVEDNSLNWLGAVLLSRNNDYKYHCELLLKRKGKYPGIMEFLLMNISEALKCEGIEELSLGEVPFKKMGFDNKSFKIILYFLKPLINISYNYEGLYFFKNKFNPTWEPVYLCLNQKIKLLDLYTLSLKTNFLKLLIYKSKRQVFNYN